MENNLLLTESQKKLLQEIKDGKHQCTYCCEQATGINASGFPVCDIPTNHPEEDKAVVKT